jgi:hypothetical protein
MPDFVARKAIEFYSGLRAPHVPAGITVMSPYRDDRVLAYVRLFLEKFYSDYKPRVLVLGINPGRFGAGVTGVTFTDPVALADRCGIPNHLPKRRELSSEFVYQVVDRMGGVSPFFGRFFLSAVCPLGFTRDGRNLNYYDDRSLLRLVEPFIAATLKKQVEVAGRRDVAIILGRKNAGHVDPGIFERIEVLDHPRFILQYRRRRVEEYVRRYEAVLRAAAS